MQNHLLPSKLRDLRKAFGYTQYDVAAVLGVVRQTYAQYETGKRVPSAETLYKLAGLYQIPVEEFMQLTIKLDAEDSFDAPPVKNTGSKLAAFTDYLNDPYNKKKLQYMSPEEKDLIFCFEQLPKKDKTEILKIIKLKLENHSES